MYTLIKEDTIYPGIDWITLRSYLSVLAVLIVACLAFALNYYFWKLVKLPRIN